MKLSRLVVLLVLAAICGLLAWNYLPGCRQAATDAYRKYGGWTEDARREDPVGFIEYAQARLNENLAAFGEAQVNLVAARQTISDELALMQRNMAAAEDLAGRFREVYRAAEDGGGYPARVAGREYERQELVNQVAVILRQRADYERLIADFAKASKQVDEKEGQLATQMTNTRAALATLPSKKEIARINELTGDTEDLLAQVSDLIGDNEAVLTASPVRTVEELVRAQQRVAASEARTDVDAEAFLEGVE